MDRHLLDWLPHPEEVFPKEHDGYLWTTVHLSGTLDAPQQDLSPLIMEAVKDEPGAAVGLYLVSSAFGWRVCLAPSDRPSQGNPAGWSKRLDCLETTRSKTRKYFIWASSTP